MISGSFLAEMQTHFNLHYKAIPNRFAERIRNQSETPEATDSAKDDLFHEDTQFIIKDGTIYYLPQ